MDFLNFQRLQTKKVIICRINYSSKLLAGVFANCLNVTLAAVKKRSQTSKLSYVMYVAKSFKLGIT